MLRVCPRCGDYYAGEELQFCLADGMPLANVIPNSPAWTNAAQVVEAKRRLFRKMQRRLKLRRVFVTMTTMLMMTVVMCVVVVNAVIYLKPPSDTPRAATVAPTPTPSPKASPRSTLPPLAPLVPLLLLPKPSPSPSPSPRHLAAPAPAECSPANEQREKPSIVSSVRNAIEAERSQVLAETQQRQPPAVAVFELIESQITFSRNCKTAVVSVKYVWQIRNPAIAPISRKRQRTLRCERNPRSWTCS